MAAKENLWDLWDLCDRLLFGKKEGSVRFVRHIFQRSFTCTSEKNTVTLQRSNSRTDKW